MCTLYCTSLLIIAVMESEVSENDDLIKKMSSETFYSDAKAYWEVRILLRFNSHLKYICEQNFVFPFMLI